MTETRTAYKRKDGDYMITAIEQTAAIARFNDMADDNERYGMKLRSLVDVVHNALHSDWPRDECEPCDYLAADVDLAAMHSVMYPLRTGLIP